jgi:acyl-CoA thioester hydrolase
MTVRIDVPLRWGDLDAQGHGNNARFVDYLQEARADYLLGSPLAGLLGHVVVANQQIEYRSPVAFSTTPLAVEVCVVRVSAARFTLGYTLHQDDRLCAVARTTLCPYDYATGGPRRVPAEARDWLAGRI